MGKNSAALKFPTELKEIKYEIEDHARAYGLDFFPVIFEVLDYRELNEVAAYTGFPYRYPHWRFGMDYDRLSKSHAYGLSKIYEMVINNNPCYAYLLKCNNLVDQKLVMAHVYGHCDFFKNNLYFGHTNRKMVDEMANHGARIQRYADRYGVDLVEGFIDCCLSLENLVDSHWPFIKRGNRKKKGEAGSLEVERSVQSGKKECRCNHDQEGISSCPTHQCGSGSCSGPENVPCGDGFFPDDDEPVLPRRLQSKGYMENYINPPEFLDARTAEMQARQREKKRFPETPQRDVLFFLIDHAPLKNWQRDILSIIREEAYYFLPQGQTKIMNEGWATYWHSRIMTERVLDDGEIIDYADHHSGTVGGSRLYLNPYKLGIELFRDIEDRWNKGRFGKDYEECEDMAVKNSWNLELNSGRTKIFEVRRLYNDLTFIDTFLTEDFCRRHKLFIYSNEDKKKTWVIKTREFEKVKEMILSNLTNLGRPSIKVVDGNFENRGELLMCHQYDGKSLQWNFAHDTLVNTYRLWKRPVHVETEREGKRVRLSYDGQEKRILELD
jgi:stage V sporulation protein R